MSELSPALKAALVEDLAQLLVRARRRRLAERTDPLGGTTVATDMVNAGAQIAHEALDGEGA